MGNITWEILCGKQFMGIIMRNIMCEHYLQQKIMGNIMWKTVYGKYYATFYVEVELWEISCGEYYLGQQFTGVFSFSFFPGTAVGIKQHLSVNDKMIRW